MRVRDELNTAKLATTNQGFLVLAARRLPDDQPIAKGIHHDLAIFDPDKRVGHVEGSRGREEHFFCVIWLDHP